MWSRLMRSPFAVAFQVTLGVAAGLLLVWAVWNVPRWCDPEVGDARIHLRASG
jgi:hypothetical protein